MILGIELGSTRIKSVLIDNKANVIAKGAYDWENKLVNGIWTYSLEDVWKGIQGSYSDLNKDYFEKKGEYITNLDSIGISAMMHGYLPFDKDGNQLCEFRTWRNTITGEASNELTKELDFHMPQRWSTSHFYQAILNNEEHISKVHFLTTLSGYVHYMLTGEKVLGIGDASGMFPIDGKDYDKKRIEIFNKLLLKKGIKKDYYTMLPKCLVAGQSSSKLTSKGALLLDPTGKLQSGVPLCPPEGDAGTGMVATCSIRQKTGNVSAGTSAFVMLVLEKALSRAYSEIDMVTTPDGSPVAMVHVNNCSSEIDAWMSTFNEVIELFGGKVKKSELYDKLLFKSQEADQNVGGITGYNFLSGEHVANCSKGSPMFARSSDGKLNLANFMKMQVYSATASLRQGMNILEKEGVSANVICGHGGFFKTELIGQSAMSAALKSPIMVMKNASEGGAWGIAILALYLLNNNVRLDDYLDGIFKDTEKTILEASDEEKIRFENFIQRYTKCIEAERELTELIN